MSLKEQFKQEVQTERRKLKDMSFQDKLWYIWEYYKFHMGGVIIAIMLLYVVGTSIYNSTIHPGLYCAIINNYSNQELDVSLLEEDFHAYMNFGKKEPVYVESMFITYGDNATEYSYASMAKISALVASRDLDVLIADKENIDHYASMDGLSDLKQVLPEDILQVVEDRLIYSTSSTGESVAVSIDIAGTPFALAMHLSDNASNLTLLDNSTHRDNGIALIRYIFDL